MSSPPSGASPAPTSPPSPPPPAANTTTPPYTANNISPTPNTKLVALGVGVGLGGAIVLLVVGIFVWCKRRKRRHGLAGSSGKPPLGPKDEPLDGLRQQWQQSAPPPTDCMVGLLPKPSPPPGIVVNPQVSPMRVPTRPPASSMASSLDSEKSFPQSSPGLALVFSKTTFTYKELSRATDGFSNANFLGEGGFGYVHKGILLNGKDVAIKQLKIGSGQGEREFQAEVEIISRVHHRHLVSLVGYCISGAQRMLVYEFVPNYTLEFHLHGFEWSKSLCFNFSSYECNLFSENIAGKGRTPLSWANRIKIALGSAKGLAYLHEDCQPKIIHRDIKAANILLDYNFEAKVADFGLARLNWDTDTHISTRVMGTFGYLAPEYALTGKLTDKSDVFSFGVMVLELITGHRPIDKTHFVDHNIVDWARPLLTQALEDGNFETLADPRLQKDYDSTEMTRMVACAAVCVRHFARRRPRMSQIVRALEGNMSLDDLNEGIRPGQSTVYGSHESSEYDTSCYKEDLKKFEKLALESHEHIASECSGPTSEFDLQPSASSSEVLQTTQERGSSSERHRSTQDRNGENEEKHGRNS